MLNKNSVPHPRSLSHSFAFAGGIVGLVTYLVVALLPSIVYGGFVGVTLASGIFGTPVDANILARVVVLFGMVVGLLATAGLFVVVGAALGAAVYAIVRAMVPAGADKPGPERHETR